MSDKDKEKDPKATEGDPKGNDDGKKESKNQDPKGKSPVSDEDHRKVVSESIKRKEKIRELEAVATTRGEEFETLEGEVESLKSKFKDVDVEKYSAFLKAESDAERDGLEAKGEYKRILKQVGEEHDSAVITLKEERDAEYKTRDGKITRLEVQVENLTIGREFSDSKFVREELTLTATKARQVWGSHFEVNDEGKVVAYDKPAGAEDRTPYVNGEGKPLGFSEAFKRIVESDPERDQLVRSKLKPGAGSSSDGDKAPVSQVKSSREKISAGMSGVKLNSGPTF